MPTIVARLRAAGCVFAEDEAAILRSAASATELDRLVQRRVNGEPLEYVVGWAQFHGQRIQVEPGVFIPRRRTEFLVDVALRILAAGGQEAAIVVDLCCGSGAIGAALLATWPQITLFAVDNDPRAVRCARLNVGDERVHEGDLYDPLPHRLRKKVRLIVANTPYVPTGDIRLLPREARLHEPRKTLDGGSDGLDIQRRIAARAPEWLTPGGQLLVETSARQAPETARIFAGHGLSARVEHVAEVDATMVIGTLFA